MILTALTLFHVLVSLVGIFSGFFVLLGLVQRNRSDHWTKVYFATTVATSVTGFFFPVDRLLPSHVVGLISLIILGAAIHAYYRRNLIGVWRKVYVIGATAALYLNVFVAIVQAFQKIPVLKALAPTQSELPFKLTQSSVLVAFVGLGTIAWLRFRSAQNAARLKQR